MRIKVLGCSGAVSPGYNTTSILIDEAVLIDAGSAASAMSAEELCGLRHIFLTYRPEEHGPRSTAAAPPVAPPEPTATPASRRGDGPLPAE